MPLTPFCLMLSACLRVIPDKSQFFQYDAISLSCDDPLNSTKWKVKRSTVDGGVRPCSFSWGSTSSGSTCIIKNSYPSDSGVYWCESADGNKSNAVNITITEATVILESPALPVSKGAALTLRCQAKSDSTNQMFQFYKDNQPVSRSSTGEMTIHGVSKSDEGFYKCSVSENESRASWVAVEGATDMNLSTARVTDFPLEDSTSAAASHSVSVLRVVCHLLVGTPYLLSTILLGLIYRDRKRAAQMAAGRRGSSDVIMEIVVQPPTDQ